MRHGIINKANLKGGEKMRLVLVMLVIAGIMLGGAAFAEQYSLTLYPNPVNWFSLPGVPFDPSPATMFGADLIDGSLSRLDPTVNGTIMWEGWEEGFTFGGMLLGEGYKLNILDGQEHTISYAGAPNGLPDANGLTDMWISLPGVTGEEGGIHWIGFPYDGTVLFTDVLVTDGTKTIPVFSFDPAVETAMSLGWLEGYWAYMENVFNGTSNVDPEEIIGSPYLESGKLYEVITHKANLALIIPAPAAN